MARAALRLSPRSAGQCQTEVLGNPGSAAGTGRGQPEQGVRSSLSCSPERPVPRLPRAAHPGQRRALPTPWEAAGVSAGPQQQTWSVSRRRRCSQRRWLTGCSQPAQAPGLQPQGGGLRGAGFVTEISKNPRLGERQRAPDLSSSDLGARPGEGVQHVGATYPACVRAAHVRALLRLRLYLCVGLGAGPLLSGRGGGRPSCRRAYSVNEERSIPLLESASRLRGAFSCENCLPAPGRRGRCQGRVAGGAPAGGPGRCHPAPKARRPSRAVPQTLQLALRTGPHAFPWVAGPRGAGLWGGGGGWQKRP